MHAIYKLFIDLHDCLKSNNQIFEIFVLRTYVLKLTSSRVGELIIDWSETEENITFTNRVKTGVIKAACVIVLIRNVRAY